MAATGRQERKMEKKYERENMKAKTSLELFRDHVLSHGGTRLEALGKAFRRADKGKDNMIDYEEFKTVLHVFGFTLEPDEERELIKSMDLDRTRTLTYDEFIIALRPPMSPRRRELVSRAFRILDKNGDGVVTPDDLKDVYSPKEHPKYISGEWTEQRVFAEYLNNFRFDAGDKDGTITEIEFQNYYERLNASIDSDDYFEYMMTQAWKL